MTDPRSADASLPGGYLRLPRPVWQLGWVSFFTDVAGEMVYPLLPMFLTVVLGASAMSLGVIEGVAEAANSLLKIGSGWLADRWHTPKALVLGGYTLSSGLRPLIAFVASWPQLLLLRFGDRLGKGIRSSPRDAMLARFAPPDRRGLVFGFHQSMDHAGAVLGPLIASAYLYFHHDAYRSLFAWTLVPGIVVVLVLLRLPNARLDDERPPVGRISRPGGPGARLPPRFYRAIAVIFVFTLGNASDTFLLLRLAQIGIAEVWIPLLWSALHVVKMTTSLVGGSLSDRVGRRTMIGWGWLVYAAVYAGFGHVDDRGGIIAIFLAYGLYFGLTEGVEKAWVADMAPAHARGTAFGLYNGVLGIGGLAASLLSGYIWTRVSPHAAFLTGAALALAATLLLYFVFSHDATEG
ncbi:MAG TPA: MFS transporter [Vicinamibacterales bacterium]|nr:MFS transporter [Vicinamibacterales bacterium]